MSDRPDPKRCDECGSHQGPGGWLWHARTCSAGRLPKDAQERIRAGVEESRRARLAAMVEARTAALAGVTDAE